ncbi:transposable element Tcb2 transposase [Trichonephila clavipes]|nr:transposable element Tcb2 transposase [Trichonephila clavipes]
MNSRRETSENERALVIKWSKDGKSLREIASLIGKSHGCIQKILQKYHRTGCVANIPGRERKEILNHIAKRKIIRSVKKNPLLSAPKLASSISSEIGGKVSAETVRRVLHKAGFDGRTPERRGQYKVWRKVGKELDPKNTIKRRLSMEVDPSLCLGCRSAGGVGELVFIDGMDKMVCLEILRNNLQKSAVNVGLGSNFIFQQDNDPKHTAKMVKLYLLYHCKKEIHTPPQFPDLNVIENLWSQLEK